MFFLNFNDFQIIGSSPEILVRLRNGKIQNKPFDPNSRTSIEDTLARRTFDESGNYVVNDFELDIREHLLSGTNRGIYATGATSDDGNTASESKLAFGLSQGKAYVHGYEIGKIGTTYIDVDKARDFETDTGSTTRYNIGSFVNVENVFGSPDINFVSGEVENYKTLRLVDTPHTTRGTVFGTSLAHVFDIGRAKTRAFEYNSGSAISPDSGTTTHLSNAATTSVKFKHFLFDVEMFSHVNVQGAMSGALTTGDKLTGGTSGATGIIESVSTAGSATITGITKADPPVVTCSGGHNFTEGQTITIASVAGMTQVNTNHTVKNPAATTFELYELATATNNIPEPVDGHSTSKIHVELKSSQNQVNEFEKGTLRTHITTLPTDGKANSGVIALLAKTLVVGKFLSEIVRCNSSRNKIVSIQTLNPPEILIRIKAATED